MKIACAIRIEYMLDRLRNVLQQDDAVLFVGAGISSWSGVPRWTAFIDELSAFLDDNGLDSSLVRAEIARNDLLQAASYAFDQLTATQTAAFLRKACRVSTARPHEIHRRLVTMGPKCFITTNYDKLIENSLSLWMPGTTFQTVTNRHLVEIAEIIQARATNFIFKPHGDIDDVQSIVLTREQYRVLLPGGERHHALETLRILLASRPVLYVGFGLRDPDFLLIRDLLANTYKGGIRDHYAIMADVTRAEIDYWKRNYGIHLLPYQTNTLLDGSPDHATLLALLEELGPRRAPPADRQSTAPESQGDRFLLPLMRHAARLSRFEPAPKEFPLRVLASHKLGEESPFEPFDGTLVERFLDRGPDKVILIGPPGAGKTYALLNSARRLAEGFYRNCLSEQSEPDGAVLPVFVDLKLYAGNLAALIEKSLPSRILLDDLISTFKLKIFVDAFNEMPREFLESGGWEADFRQFLVRAGSASVVIASRAADVLERLELPVFSLEELDATFVRTELSTRGIKIRQRFEDELGSILRKPFYFKLAISGRISLRPDTHPKEVYSQLLDQLTGDFKSKFGKTFDLASPLSRIAFEAVDSGREALPLALVQKHLAIQLQEASIADVDSIEIVNWFIAKDFLLSYSGARLAFFHQSMTEYLAAKELAAQYQTNSAVLKEKMRWHRWDQALFLTVGQLPRQNQRNFIADVIKLDFALSFSAVKFMETGSDLVVRGLLTDLSARLLLGTMDFEKGRRLSLLSLPVSNKHGPLLRKLVPAGEFIGAHAVVLLFRMGSISLDDVIDLFVIHRNDYNFCTEIGRQLGPLFKESDLALVARAADRYQRYLDEGEKFSEHQGFTNALSEMLQRVSPSHLQAELIGSLSVIDSRIRLELLLDALGEQRSSEGLAVTGDLLLTGVQPAVVPFYFIAHFAQQPLTWSFVGPGHLQRCMQLIQDGRLGPWALDCIKEICKHRTDLSQIVLEAAAAGSPIRRACLLWAASPDPAPVFDALRQILTLSTESILQGPLEALGHVELDWRGKENLFVSLLRLRCVPFAQSLVSGEVFPFGLQIGLIEIGPIQWWLDWLQEIGVKGRWWMYEDRLARVFDKHLRPDVRESFLHEFNDPNSSYRDVLVRSILSPRNDLSTDDFSDDALSFLMAGLSRRKQERRIFASFLGQTTSEKFATGILIPALAKASGSFKRALEEVLDDAGRRHGRRYLLR